MGRTVKEIYIAVSTGGQALARENPPLVKGGMGGFFKGGNYKSNVWASADVSLPWTRVPKDIF